MFLPQLMPSKLLVPSLVIAVFLVSLQLAQAKSIRSLGYSNLRTSDAIKMRRGGCAAFGHSCFGGHGKRSDSTINPTEGEDTPANIQLPTDDVKTYIVSEGFRTPIDIFSRDQPDELNFVLPSQYQQEDFLRFSPLFRKWLANTYRRDLAATSK